MDDLSKKLNEARLTCWLLQSYSTIIDFFVAFLFSAIIINIFGVPLIYGVVPGIIYSIGLLYKRISRGDIVCSIENQYKNLDERLSTAQDNIGRDNIILQSLRKDMVKKMESVESSTFFESRRMALKIGGVIAMSFILISMSVADIQDLDQITKLKNLDAFSRAKKLRSGLTENPDKDEGINRREKSNYSTEEEIDQLGAGGGGLQPGYSEGPLAGKGAGVGEDSPREIYGDASTANLLGDDLDFQLHPEYNGQIEIRETERENRLEDFTIPEIRSYDACRECAIGPEHEEIIRRYFEKISEG